MKRRSLLAFAAASMILTGCSTTPPPVSAKVQAAYEKGVNLQTPTPKPTKAIAPLSFAAGTRTVFFGDSWTSGLFMEPETKGYAYLTAGSLGLDAEVLGGNGTGYLNAGNNIGSYGQRIAALPVDPGVRLLVLQGSVNDLGNRMNDLGPAFDETLKKARQKFPKAQIVVIGSSTAQWPVQPALRWDDDILGAKAAAAGIPYISPYMEGWINEENFSKMIDANTGHMSEAGHAYFASKVVAALKALKAK